MGAEASPAPPTMDSNREPQPHRHPAREQAVRAEDVIAAVDSHWGAACAGCRIALLGHDVVVSMLMGFVDAPRCLACLAGGVGDELAPFVRRAHANVRRLACYRAGWRHSDRRVATAGDPWPEERIPKLLRLEDEDDLEGDPSDTVEQRPEPATPVAARFDAGDMGCGDLVLELRARLAALAPGAVLEVRATDPGAPGDLPAWCRVTKNPLVQSEHPYYWIQRRTDAPLR